VQRGAGAQNFILLGLRGQAKSRILRQLTSLLDEALPVLAGTETNDDPLRPISRAGRLLVEEAGDDAPIAWLGATRATWRSSPPPTSPWPT
jgi:magnesium chelatase subunit I